MLRDFHTHTRASDGELEAIELFQRAGQNGVSQLAITDHDTVQGIFALQQHLREIRENSALNLPELVPGVEITSMAGRHGVHVLGLWIDPHSSHLQTLLERQFEVRECRAREIGLRLAKQGIVNAYEGAAELAAGASLSRPHFARYLIQQKHCKNEQQAFRRWLGRGKAGDVRCDWPALKVVVDTIHRAGGVAVLAHPEKYQLTRTRLRELLGLFREVGGDAMELISGAQLPAVTRELLALSGQFGLACSSGSDFHSPAQLWCDVGRQPAMPDAAKSVWSL